MENDTINLKKISKPCRHSGHPDAFDNKRSTIKSKIFRISNRINKKRQNFLLKTVGKSRFLRRNPNNHKKLDININKDFINEDS